MKANTFLCVVVMVALRLEGGEAQELSARLSIQLVDERQTSLEHFMLYNAARFSLGLPDSSLKTDPPLQSPMCAVISLRDSVAPISVIFDSDNAQHPRIWLCDSTARSPHGLRPIPYVSLANGSLRAVVNTDFSFRDGSRRSHMLPASLELLILPSRKALMYRLADIRVGQMRIGKSSYQVALVRETGQLQFTTDAATLFMIDENRDGMFSANAHMDSSGSLIDREAFHANTPFRVDQAAYVVENISPDGKEVHLRKSQAKTVAALGFELPELSARLLSGDSVSLDTFRGRTLVINWWATSCPPCIAEIPGLNQLVAKYRNDRSVAFIAVAWNTPEELKQFLVDHSMDYVTSTSTIDPPRFLGNVFPRHIIVDPKGRVVFDETGGYPDRYKELDAALSRR
jgi:thiol-disulfide isomerase/thioredoxin